MTNEKPKNLPKSDVNKAWDDIKQGNLDEALRRVENISRNSRDYMESRFILARVAWLQGFTEAAMVILDEAAKNNPNDPRILTELAVLQLNDGQTDKALGTLNKATANDSFLPEAEIARYVALHILGEKKQAKKTLESLHERLFTDY